MSDQKKNPYFYVGAAMVIGVICFIFAGMRDGEKGEVALWVAGGLLFGGGFGALIMRSFKSPTKP